MNDVLVNLRTAVDAAAAAADAFAVAALAAKDALRVRNMFSRGSPGWQEANREFRRAMRDLHIHQELALAAEAVATDAVERVAAATR